MNWISTGTCDAAAQFGWFLGALTGTLADIIVVILIATAPTLGSERLPGPPPWQTLRTSLQHSLWLLAIAWMLGGIYAGRQFISCYSATLTIAAALTIGIVLLLVMLTAANQIAARGVQ